MYMLLILYTIYISGLYFDTYARDHNIMQYDSIIYNIYIIHYTITQYCYVGVLGIL